jgi:hypothetical protein
MRLGFLNVGQTLGLGGSQAAFKAPSGAKIPAQAIGLPHKIRNFRAAERLCGRGPQFGRPARDLPGSMFGSNAVNKPIAGRNAQTW